MIAEALKTYFPKLAQMPELHSALTKQCSWLEVKAGQLILKEGEYIKGIPLLVSGLVKVFKEEPIQGNEVLLYYIKPGESCVMSVTTLIKNGKSQVKAIVEEDSEIIFLPAEKTFAIANTYPHWNTFIYDLFDLKFDELLNIIEILTFSTKNTRLIEYLKTESRLKNTKIIHTTHKQIAYDLGSSREVISRLLKKLEHDNIIQLSQGVITLL